MPNPDGSPSVGEEGYVAPAEYTIAKEDDGMLKINEVRYVPETDLQANKTANETRIAEMAELHKSEVSKYMGGESTVRTLLLQTQAENENLKTQVAGHGDVAANLTKVTSDLTTANSNLETASALALDFRKKFMVKEYGVEAAKLEGKDMNALSFFEEALVAVQATGGAGNYAVGGGSGANGTPLTSEARMQQTLDNTLQKK